MDVDDDSPRTTRTRTGSILSQRAMDALHSPRSQKVIVDEDKLQKLLDRTVRQTHNFNVEKLEKLFSHFTQCIYQHRTDYDKSALIQVPNQNHRDALNVEK